MRSEENPLDLNNLPEDYTRDDEEVFDDSSSSSAAGYRKKKSGGKDGKDDSGKVHECRFCSLKFCKSQALGGHMNRHRQERETETLNKARQLVFTNDLAPGAHHLGYLPGGQPIPNGGFHQTPANMGDATMPFRSMYPTRLFSGSSPLLPSPPPGQPPPQPPYMYTSPSRLLPLHSQYPAQPVNDYFVGRTLSGSNSRYIAAPPPDTNYTCIGAPVGHGFSNGAAPGSAPEVDGVRDLSKHIQDEGLNWGRR